MNTQEFVEAIRKSVDEGSVEALKSVLTKPPGRSPKQEWKELSKWYNEGDDDQKSKIISLIKEAVSMSVFSFLCVLDGIRAIENSFDKGQLFLYYEKDKQRVLLNDPDKEYLHDLL